MSRLQVGRNSVEYLARRFRSKIFWLLVLWAVVEDVTFFIPLTSLIIWIGLFYPRLFEMIISLLYRFCRDVNPERYRENVNGDRSTDADGDNGQPDDKKQND